MVKQAVTTGKKESEAWGSKKSRLKLGGLKEGGITKKDGRKRLNGKVLPATRGAVVILLP